MKTKQSGFSPAFLFAQIKSSLRSLTVFSIAGLMSACGGGGGGGSDAVVSSSGSSGSTFQPSQNFAARCASPRTGIDPYTGSAYPDRAGSVTQENQWLRSWTHELYLWYREVPDSNPSSYNDPIAYFDVLKTPQTTASGQPKDKFHFTYPTAAWKALSQGGVQSGYGAQWAVLAGAPPRDVRVAYIEPVSSPAATANLARGTKILAVDGIDIVHTVSNSDIDAINAALYPNGSGQSHTFTVQDAGSSSQRAVTMTFAAITSVPVQGVQKISLAGGDVGYLLFNSHVATAEQQLVAAVQAFNLGAGISDLIIDLRYNGGGYLDIASELAYMIAGPSRTAGKTFEALQFNDQYTTRDPVTGAPLTPVPFHNTTQGFSMTAGLSLPTLNLSRVFILTGEDSCSASESIINSLRGVDVNVIQIGSTTCGKPYGFYPADNCGTTYFSIQFRGVNNKGFGDYSDGFSPINSSGFSSTSVPGCSVGDDFSHALGDVAEARLAAALNYRLSGTCPAPSGFVQPTLRFSAPPSGPALVAPLSPLNNRLLR